MASRCQGRGCRGACRAARSKHPPGAGEVAALRRAAAFRAERLDFARQRREGGAAEPRVEVEERHARPVGARVAHQRLDERSSRRGRMSARPANVPLVFPGAARHLPVGGADLAAATPAAASRPRRAGPRWWRGPARARPQSLARAPPRRRRRRRSRRSPAAGATAPGGRRRRGSAHRPRRGAGEVRRPALRCGRARDRRSPAAAAWGSRTAPTAGRDSPVGRGSKLTLSAISIGRSR